MDFLSSLRRRIFKKKQPQPLPEKISFDLLKDTLKEGNERNKIYYYNDNVEVSYKYEDDYLQIYSISIKIKNIKYVYKRSNLPYTLFNIFKTPEDEIPDVIPIYLNIENLNKPIIKINGGDEISNIEVDKVKQGDALGLRERFSGGKKSRKRRSQKKKRKSQKSKKLRNQNKSKKRRSQKKKQRKTHRKRK